MNYVQEPIPGLFVQSRTDQVRFYDLAATEPMPLGDSVLSIILCKSFLLAEDTKITDPTIISQLRTN